jgi:hypothetical protein
MTTTGTPAALLRDAEAAPTPLAHGPWTAQLRGGEIDDIGFDGRLVLRGIRFVVRDHDWRTVASRVTGLEIAGDVVVVTGEATADAISVGWTLDIRFDDAALTVELDARVRSDFPSNRMGLIVLHPPSLAGAALAVTHPDGSTTHTSLPVDIAPHQPAADIAGLAWSADGVSSRLSLEGDVFEMEDQRNWTDASFKTYSTPLSRPFPVQNRAGDRVRQSLRLECIGHGETEPRGSVSPVTLTLDPRGAGVMPAIATAASSAPDEAHTRAPVDTLLVEVDARWPNWRAALARSVADAAGRRLDLRIVAALPCDVADVLGALDDAALSTVARAGAFDATSTISEPELVSALEAVMSARGSDAALVVGTRAHFTELNRQHHRLTGEGALTFSITPTMHDLSGHQVVESIGMQREVARNAARIARGRPVHIGPVSLRARFNAVATSPPEYPEGSTTAHGFGPQHTRGTDDPGQASNALAAWVVGSVAALSAHGAASLAYFEEWGPRGLLIDGTPTAAGVVVGWAAELAGAARWPVASSSPHVHAVAAGDGDRVVALVGNLSSVAVEVDLSGLGADASVERTTAAGEPASPVILAPGEAARVRAAVPHSTR